MTAGRQVNSQSREWGTPPEYVSVVRKVFGGTIALDPCSNRYSVVGAEVEYRLADDGLKASWDFPTIYVNPPYGRDPERRTTIRSWLQRCAEAHTKHGSEVIALVPVATNTRHWQQSVFPFAASICFLKVPRLRFLQDGVPHAKGAPMACSLVYWGKNPKLFAEACVGLGCTVNLEGRGF